MCLPVCRRVVLVCVYLCVDKWDWDVSICLHADESWPEAGGLAKQGHISRRTAAKAWGQLLIFRIISSSWHCCRMIVLSHSEKRWQVYQTGRSELRKKALGLICPLKKNLLPWNISLSTEQRSGTRYLTAWLSTANEKKLIMYYSYNSWKKKPSGLCIWC